MPAKRCFVISPIGAPGSDARRHADIVFEGVIKPAVDLLKAEGLEIEPFRSDHLVEPGKISDQMFREIFRDDVCIAVLTFANPNVYYELAVAQCAYRRVVALLQEGERLPFDVGDLRIIGYDIGDTRRLIRKQDAAQLASHLRAVFSPNRAPPDPFGPNSPAVWQAVRDPMWLQRRIETTRPRPLNPGIDSVYKISAASGQRLVIRTGDARHVRDVGVIVSAENTDLQLARYYDPSVSGTLRYFDAERSAGGA